MVTVLSSSTLAHTHRLWVGHRGSPWCVRSSVDSRGTSRWPPGPLSYDRSTSVTPSPCTSLPQPDGKQQREITHVAVTSLRPSSVFQLGIFPRALRPARTVLRPARLKNYFFTKCNCCFCVFRQPM